MVYWHFLECSTKQPTSIGKWISEFPFLHDNDFSKFYRLPYQTVKDTKIQTFQYTVLNRILPCKEMLFKWNIEETEQCTYCNDCDTLTHFLYGCSQTKAFWQQIEKWIAYSFETHFPLSIIDVIFGIPFDNNNELLNINYVIIYGKWYIYRTKIQKETLFFLSFLTDLKMHLEIERYNMNNKGHQQLFEQKWNPLIISL